MTLPLKLPKPPAMGIKVVDRGRYRGYYCAFRQESDGTIFTGEPRRTRREAWEDVQFARELLGKVSIYVSP